MKDPADRRKSEPSGPAGAGELSLERSLREEEKLLADDLKERLQMARRIFGVFSKAVKAMNLYVGKGPHVERFIQELFKEISSYLMQNSQLRLEVTPYALLLEGHPVLSSDGVEANQLVYQLFADGIRELAFLPGLGEDELTDLMGILVENIAQADDEPKEHKDDDRVTLMWQKSFQNIQHRSTDVFSSGALFQDLPEYRGRFEAGLDSYLSRVDGRLCPGGEAPGLGQASRVAPGEEPRRREMDPYLSAFMGYHGTGALARPDMSAAEAFESYRDDRKRGVERVVEILFEMVSRHARQFEQTRAVEQVVGLVEEILLDQDLERLGAFCSVVERWARVQDDEQRQERRRAFVDALFSTLARYHRLILLREVVADASPDALAQVLRFFALIPSGELDGVVHLLTKLEEGSEAQQRLLGFLVEAGANMVAFYKQRLGQDNILVVLDALQQLSAIEGEDALVAIRGMLTSPNASIRRQAMLALKGHWSTEIFVEVLRFLQFPDVGPRLAALDVARASRDADLFEPLETITERKDFAKRDSDERRQHMSAMFACDPPRGLAYLRQKLLKRSPFAGKRGKALQEGALLAVLDLEGAESEEMLELWLSREPAKSPLRQRVVRVLEQRRARAEEEGSYDGPA